MEARRARLSPRVSRAKRFDKEVKVKRKLIAILIATMTIGSAQPVLAMEGTAQEPAQESAVQEENEKTEGAESSEAHKETEEITSADTDIEAGELPGEVGNTEEAAAEDTGSEAVAEDEDEIAAADEAEDEVEADSEGRESEEAEEETTEETTEEITEEDTTAEEAAEAETDTEAAELDTTDQEAKTEEAQAATTETLEKKEAKKAAEAVSGDYEYKSISGGVEITKYTGKAKSVSIPQKIGGYNVLSVGSSAFRGNKTITTVTFPSTVTSIEDRAFENCASLSKVTLPSNIQSLGSYVFKGTAISSVTIPASLTDVGNYGPFTGCANLTSVTFASGMTTIPYRILYNSKSVKNITIPDSVTKIEDGAFEGTSITTFANHDKITSIGDYVFEGCASLSKVTLPKNLQSLGSYAFKGTAISSITIPARLANVGNYGPFTSCANLTSVTFASGMTKIPYRILYNNSNVKHASIPVTVTSVENGAFHGCSSLTKVNFGGSKAQWNKINISNDNDPLLSANIVTLKDNQITAQNATYSYSLTDRSFSLGAKALGGTLTYSSDTPAVAVDGSGRVTISARFMGTAKITISTSGNSTYAGAKKTVTVAVPVNSSVTSVKSNSAGTIAMTWKKVSTSTGYYVQYSQKSDFSIKKTITINSNSKTSTTLTGLKKGAKYYVRVRTFKTVGGKNYYSSWCAKKAVIVRK